MTGDTLCNRCGKTYAQHLELRDQNYTPSVAPSPRVCPTSIFSGSADTSIAFRPAAAVPLCLCAGQGFHEADIVGGALRDGLSTATVRATVRLNNAPRTLWPAIHEIYARADQAVADLLAAATV
jgi:hypothetical protein